MVLAGLCVTLMGCASTVRSEKAARDLLQAKNATRESPRALVTQYSDALERFGAMLEVYRAPGRVLYVQSRNIADATGLSHPLVGAELPSDITEMVRSAINRIGDRVAYVPFQPDYVLAHAQQGARMQLTLPNVLITGAITEFDRALASAGKANNLDLSFGGGRTESEISAERKATSTLSDLTLDLNLVDFDHQVMIPKAQSANSIRVLNETFEHSYDFAIYGSAFGLVSNTKYLQGRHSAIRLLVELSVLELLGRYTMVPYWRCIPNGQPDRVVLEQIERKFLAQDRATRAKWLQETLKDYGYVLPPSHGMDDKTHAALEQVVARYNLRHRSDDLDSGLFVDLYVHIPVVRSSGRAPA
jgi:hypothetical protein